MLTAGLSWYRDTSGLFNPAVGGRLVSDGYGQSTTDNYSAEIPNLENILYIEDFGEESRVSLRGPGLIDLGGLGKGYLIDKLAGFLQNTCGLEYFLINGGGDIYVTSNRGESVEIGLEDPKAAGEYIGSLALKDQGFAASSTYKRTWQKAGQQHDHIIRENLDQGFATFVYGPSAMAADILATSICAGLSGNQLSMLAAKHNCEYHLITS